MTDTAAKAPNREMTGPAGPAAKAAAPDKPGAGPGPAEASGMSASPASAAGTATAPRTAGTSRGNGQPGGTRLITDMGKTHISDGVVAKVAGFAAKEIPGVHSMGAGMARRMGQLRSLVPGGETSRQGVSVEVGEREAAVDLDVVTYYGQSIADVSDAVRRNVIDRIQEMTGLQVVEVNVNVDDVFVEGESGSGGEADTQPQPRVH